MTTPLNRRTFIKTATAGAALASVALPKTLAALADASPSRLPRWRGFNLLEKFITSIENSPFRESDFAWMAEWGFNFARLPMSYRCWSDPKDWRRMDERVLKEIDDAIAFGRRYGVHVCLCFHRAPGYSVDASLAEPFNLWTDAEALEATAYQWKQFAARYRDIPNSALSFDLVNEPGIKDPKTQALIDDATYLRVAAALVAAIREESPNRLIIADGLFWGNIPVPALARLGIAQSTRGYLPMEVTHWKASWVEGSDRWPQPSWPFAITPEAVEQERQQLESLRQAFSENPIVAKHLAKPDVVREWNRARLESQLIRPWKDLEAMGVGVHVGEFGAYNQTPHKVTLSWMRDALRSWKEARWGWALWNFRGPFGVLDSERSDVNYETFRGHKLDREMLELLRES
ncbi:glycoside hydrolase [Opitutaceae bacterium EW11]|nr:glycoside hydrolase [Opitutaceae bacterium EW11]